MVAKLAITPKKRFGQNFLHDHAVIRSIISQINPKDNQSLVEIGPGRGALTQYLINKSNTLDVVEIDYNLVEFIAKMFASKAITIHNADALKFDFNQLRRDKDTLFIVGNLPYNISTELLFHLSRVALITDMVFMLQKEVVDRICAEPGTTNYSRLSVGLQHKYICSKLFDVSKESFYPIPKVESAIIRLHRKQNILPVNEELFGKIVTTAFNQRRKCLRNSLAEFIDFSEMKTSDSYNDNSMVKHINPMSQYAQMRPQELSVADFVSITNLISPVT